MMKRFFTVLLLVALTASVCSAQRLIGAKAGGMGGAGVANVDDLAAAYYNPAALMQSTVKAGEVKVSLGAEYTDPTDLMSALSSATNPSQFLADNYTKNLSFNGSFDGIVGVNAAKVGVSIIPIGTATLNKSANTFVGAFSVTSQYATVLTLGKTYSVPFLPAAVDVGINAKYLTANNGSITTTGTALSASGTRTTATGNGMGFDIGALTSVKVPFLASAKAGVVIRDLMQSVSYTNKSQTSYLTYTGATATVTNGAESTLPGSTTTTDPSYAVGIAGTIPGINLGLATDLEFTNSGTNTHIGLEYPLLLNTLIVRVGTASGNGLSKTTIGAKLNLPIITLDGVLVTNANNSGAAAIILDAGIGW